MKVVFSSGILIFQSPYAFRTYLNEHHVEEKDAGGLTVLVGMSP
jgi:hypothetical protein